MEIVFDFIREGFFDKCQYHEGKYLSAISDSVFYPQMDIDLMVFRALDLRGKKCLDAGANIGLTANMILAEGASKVVCVEPVPSIYDRLLSNLPKSAVGINALLVGDSRLDSPDGTRELHVSDKHNQGSTASTEILQRFPEIFSENHKVISVKSVTLQSLIAREGRFDFWKLDIEGLEVEVIRSCLQDLESASLPDYIYFESYEIFDEVFMKQISESGFHLLSVAIDDKCTLRLSSIDSLTSSSGMDSVLATSPMFLLVNTEAFPSLAISMFSKIPYGTYSEADKRYVRSLLKGSNPIVAQAPDLQNSAGYLDLVKQLDSLGKEHENCLHTIVELKKQLALSSETLDKERVENLEVLRKSKLLAKENEEAQTLIEAFKKNVSEKSVQLQIQSSLETERLSALREILGEVRKELDTREKEKREMQIAFSRLTQQLESKDGEVRRVMDECDARAKEKAKACDELELAMLQLSQVHEELESVFHADQLKRQHIEELQQKEGEMLASLDQINRQHIEESRQKEAEALASLDREKFVASERIKALQSEIRQIKQDRDSLTGELGDAREETRLCMSQLHYLQKELENSFALCHRQSDILSSTENLNKRLVGLVTRFAKTD